MNAYMSYYRYMFMEKEKKWLLRKVLMLSYFQNVFNGRILAIGSWVHRVPSSEVQNYFI